MACVNSLNSKIIQYKNKLTLCIIWSLTLENRRDQRAILWHCLLSRYFGQKVFVGLYLCIVGMVEQSVLKFWITVNRHKNESIWLCNRVILFFINIVGPVSSIYMHIHYLKLTLLCQVWWMYEVFPFHVSGSSCKEDSKKKRLFLALCRLWSDSKYTSFMPINLEVSLLSHYPFMQGHHNIFKDYN